jgi:hypothetical protein
MKLILLLSSQIHCHIIKSAHMEAYLMSMKPPDTSLILSANNSIK